MQAKDKEAVAWECPPAEIPDNTSTKIKVRKATKGKTEKKKKTKGSSRNTDIPTIANHQITTRDHWRLTIGLRINDDKSDIDVNYPNDSV